MERMQARSTLHYELGLLLRPLLDAIESPELSPFDDARIRKQFAVDSGEFRTHANDYCRVSDVDFSLQRSVIHEASAMLQGLVNQNPITSLSTQVVDEQRAKIESAIASVPVEIPSQVHEAQTPFSTYCSVRALIENASETLSYADRYVSPDLLFRYIIGVPKSVCVTIVTWPRNAHSSSGKMAYDEFLSVSRTVARERGATNYRLVTARELHDRWLLIDDVLLQLGGSLKDAAWSSPFTISHLDTTPHSVLTLDRLISSGTEIFGSAQISHP